MRRPCPRPSYCRPVKSSKLVGGRASLPLVLTPRSYLSVQRARWVSSQKVSCYAGIGELTICLMQSPVTIRLAPLLPTNVAVVQFPNVRNATEAVIEVVNAGVGIRESMVVLPLVSQLIIRRVCRAVR